jgi:hypothetical protein
MNVYARARPGLFLAFAPAVLGCIAMLLLPSLGGLIIGIGLLGLLGLIGLFGAWLSLASIWKPGGLSAAFLAIGIVAAVLAVVLGLCTRGYDIFWTGMLAGVGASYGVLALWFVCALLGKADERGAMAPEAIVLALVVALATAVVPVTALLKSRGMAHAIWLEIGSEGEAKAAMARDAVDAFAATHGGLMPDSNVEAGLPEPMDIQGRYVYSVTVERGNITVAYGNDPIATLFGVETLGARLVLTPIDRLAGKRTWSCAVSGGTRAGSPTYAGICGRPN